MMTRQSALSASMWLVAATAVLGSALFAASAQDAAPTFEARCGRCHTVDEVVAKVSARAPSEREQFLTQFLGRHFPPPENERATVATFILARVPR